MGLGDMLSRMLGYWVCFGMSMGWSATSERVELEASKHQNGKPEGTRTGVRRQYGILRAAAGKPSKP